MTLPQAIIVKGREASLDLSNILFGGKRSTQYGLMIAKQCLAKAKAEIEKHGEIPYRLASVIRCEAAIIKSEARLRQLKTEEKNHG